MTIKKYLLHIIYKFYIKLLILNKAKQCADQRLILIFFIDIIKVKLQDPMSQMQNYYFIFRLIIYKCFMVHIYFFILLKQMYFE